MGVQLGAIKRKPKGLARLWTIQNARRLVQFGFLAVITQLVVRGALTPETSPTAPPSAEAYCPFGGIETLYNYVVTGGSFIHHARLSNLVILAALVVTAVVLRSAFCGWICPFGTFQEWIMVFSRFLQRRFKPVGRLAKTLRARLAFMAAVDRPLRWAKYVILAYILGATILTGRMIFRNYDPYEALLILTEATFGAGLVILIAVVGLSLFVERPWCRYFCPLSPVIGFFGKLSPIRIERTGDYCKGCSICTTRCPMGLPVATATQITAVECNGCLNCIEVCPRGGALDLKFRWPWAKPATPAIPPLVIEMKRGEA